MEIAAKTNLFLHVGALRPDGKHEIRTLFLPVQQLTDTVTIAPSDALRLNWSGRPAGCADDENLVCRAVRAFAAHFGVSDAWEITVTKRIPVSAGLGGGSADAAAALLEMQRVTGRGNAAELAALALTLGADVPYFLNARPAVASGVGEILTPVDVPDYAAIIVYPGTPSPVGWAYQHCAEQILVPGWLPPLDTLVNMVTAARNDLAPALEEKLPLLKLLRLEMLRAGCLTALVSGSGSSLVGFTTCEKADAIRERLSVALADIRGLEIW